MTDDISRYYAAELEERLAALDEMPNEEFMTRGLVLQVLVVTVILPVLALLIGWMTL